MKFGIRFADQIVGLVIILALASIAFVIVMLGQAQRWFAKDLDFTTVLPTAGGLSKNMAVQYRGFTIGNVKDFYLNDNDNVEVVFTIHENYTDRVRQGSIVELQNGIIALLGSSFLFHPGKGEILAEGTFIPIAGTPQARELERQGLASVSTSEDQISNLLTQVNSTLSGVNQLLADLEEALGPGTDATEIGQMIGSVRTTLAGVEPIPQTVNNTVSSITAEVNRVIANINSTLAELNQPDGLIYTVLDTDKEVYTSLVSSLESVSGILSGIDETVAFLPSQLPQIAGILSDLRGTLSSVDDVLEGLTNNPLLRGGISDRPAESQSTGPRNIRF